VDDDRVLSLLLDEEELLAAVIPPPPPLARIALMAPVAGMDLANAKNSSLRSAIVPGRLLLLVVWGLKSGSNVFPRFQCSSSSRQNGIWSKPTLDLDRREESMSLRPALSNPS
jgi:hypothetical protein